MKVNPMNDFMAMYFLSKGIINVDNEGQIWKTKTLRGSNFTKWTWRESGCRRTETKTSRGYLVIRLNINNHRFHVYAHRIVWIAKHGSIPIGFDINHKNGIKNDNHPANLELLTRSENQKHSFEVLGRQPTINIGEDNGITHLTKYDIREIRRLYRHGGIFQKDIGVIYRVSQCAISAIVREKSWAHI